MGALFVLAGCEKNVELTASTMLNNQTKNPVYLWAGEKGKPDSSDLVAPGQFRQLMLSFHGVESDSRGQSFADQIRVHASKDLSSAPNTEVLEMSGEYEAGKTIYVRWLDAGFKLDY